MTQKELRQRLKQALRNYDVYIVNGDYKIVKRVK